MNFCPPLPARQSKTFEAKQRCPLTGVNGHDEDQIHRISYFIGNSRRRGIRRNGDPRFHFCIMDLFDQSKWVL